LLALLLRRELPLRGARLGEALGKTLLAGALMAIVIFALSTFLPPSTLSRSGALIRIAIAGGLASLSYFGLSLALRVEALDFFARAVAVRVRPGRVTRDE